MAEIFDSTPTPTNESGIENSINNLLETLKERYDTSQKVVSRLGDAATDAAGVVAGVVVDHQRRFYGTFDLDAAAATTRAMSMTAGDFNASAAVFAAHVTAPGKDVPSHYVADTMSTSAENTRRELEEYITQAMAYIEEQSLHHEALLETDRTGARSLSTVEVDASQAPVILDPS